MPGRHESAAQSRSRSISSARVVERGTVVFSASSSALRGQRLLVGRKRRTSALHRGIDLRSGISARRRSSLIQVELWRISFPREAEWRKSACALPDSAGLRKTIRRSVLCGSTPAAMRSRCCRWPRQRPGPCGPASTTGTTPASRDETPASTDAESGPLPAKTFSSSSIHKMHGASPSATSKTF